MEGDSRNPRVSLLKKYDIPVDHLTYEYIEQCSNKKELERIVRILRSGEEGMYPDLIKNAEEKLRKLAPNSRALRVEAPILTKDSLTEEEWKEVEEDLLSWENEMKVMDKSLEFEKKRFDLIGNKNLPDVRKVMPQAQSKAEKKKVKIETNNKNERIKSGDYTSWDKFDVDKELLKIDLEEEKKVEENAKKKREIEKQKKEEKKIEIVNPEAAKSCTTTEQQILANQAKDRGNECFKSGDLDNALKYYGVSIKLHATANAYNNRAMTYIKLKKYENALTDCNEVLKLEPNNVKALHRRATAYQNIPGEGNDKLALQDLTRIISLEPNNKVAQTDLQALKKKLKIEDNGRRFRMAISETDHGDASSEKKSGGNKSNNYFYDNAIPVEKLPLTFYGPSTSTFECEPLSITHRFLSGPTLSGRVMCKCNSNSPRQNPLCQRCGEQLCRPKPVPKTKKIENKDVKTDNNKKNELLKQNQEKPEPSKPEPQKGVVNEKILEKKEDGVDKNKESVNEINEKSKSVKVETEVIKSLEKEEGEKVKKEVNEKPEKEVQKNLQKEEQKNPQKEVNKKFKEDWENFINSKFDGPPKYKRFYPNNKVDDGKTAFITEIFDEDDVKEDRPESVKIEEEKADEAPERKQEKDQEILEKKEENIVKKCEDEKNVEEKSIGDSLEKAIEKDIEDSEKSKKEKNIENECKQCVDNKEIEENNVTQEEAINTKDSNSDNQSLPSTSSQTEKKSKNKKKKQRDRTNRDCNKYSYPGPVKVQQASKYLKPTSVEPKSKSETSDTETCEDMIKNSSNLHFKNFVPNRKCLSTEDVLKSNRSPVLSMTSNDRDNRLESHNGDGDKIRNDVNEEGNKENISESCNVNNCNDGGGEEVKPVRRLESGYEFIKEWESYKKTDDTYVKRAEIMKLLRPCDLGKVIGNKLDSEMLKSMLECLERHFMETDPKTAVEFLKQLIHVPRFGTVRLFMDSSEKKIIERLVESAESKGLPLDQEVKKGWTIA